MVSRSCFGTVEQEVPPIESNKQRIGPWWCMVIRRKVQSIVVCRWFVPAIFNCQRVSNQTCPPYFDDVVAITCPRQARDSTFISGHIQERRNENHSRAIRPLASEFERRY